MTIDRKSLAIVAIVGSAVGVLAAQGHPSHVIRNGEITARVYLPDATAGFYRSTRFDWSGAIASLEYKGHTSITATGSRRSPTSTTSATTSRPMT